MRIDAHVEFSREFPPERLAPILARNRFDGCIAVCFTSEEKDWLDEQARRHSFILAAVKAERVAGMTVERAGAREALYVSEWLDQLILLSPMRQVYCKVGGPLAARVLPLFGHDRVMFASGWPRGVHAGAWKQSLAAFTQAHGPVPQEIHAKLLGGTAAAFYGL